MYLTNGFVELLHHDPERLSDRAWGAAHTLVIVALKLGALVDGIARMGRK